jgi:hypothetical protein
MVSIELLSLSLWDRRMKYKRQLMLQDPKLAEEFEANEMHDDDGSMDETDLASPKMLERLARPKRKTKAKESKCMSHSCGTGKSEPWSFEPTEGESLKHFDQVRSTWSFSQHLMKILVRLDRHHQTRDAFGKGG